MWQAFSPTEWKPLGHYHTPSQNWKYFVESVFQVRCEPALTSILSLKEGSVVHKFGIKICGGGGGYIRHKDSVPGLSFDPLHLFFSEASFFLRLSPGLFIFL